MPFTKDQKRKITDALTHLAQFRLKMAEAVETSTKLGICFRELERQAAQAYDELRGVIRSTENMERSLRRLVKKPKPPAPIPAG